MSSFAQPQKPATVSHWIATNSGPTSLFNHGKNDPLPEKADIVIVGAGIAGALLAYHLTHPEDGPSVEGRKIVILEGKEVCNAATGRNGGHFAPATFSSLAQLTKSKEEGGKGMNLRDSINILEHEWDNYIRNVDVIKKHSLEDKVDLWQGRVMTVYNTEKQVTEAQQKYQIWCNALKEFGLEDKSEHFFCTDPAEAVKISRVKGAAGFSTRNAGSVQPHKLTTELIRLALKSKHDDVSLFTSTPLLSMSDKQNDEEEIELKTNRGTIFAKNVVLCTNAHTPHLFPNNDDPLKTFIYPVRVQMGLFTPPPSFCGEKSLEATYGFPVGYCATSTSGIVVGITIEEYLGEGIGQPEVYIGNSDDSELLPGCTQFLEGFMERTMDGWEEGAEGEGLTRTWMGVQGITVDRLPLIGAIPNRPGLYMTAGFNGHGMSTTHTCARAISRLLTIGQWDADFPEAYKITDQRLQRKMPEGGVVKHFTNYRRKDYATLDA